MSLLFFPLAVSGFPTQHLYRAGQNTDAAARWRRSLLFTVHFKTLSSTHLSD